MSTHHPPRLVCPDPRPTTRERQDTRSLTEVSLVAGRPVCLLPATRAAAAPPLPAVLGFLGESIGHQPATSKLVPKFWLCTGPPTENQSLRAKRAATWTPKKKQVRSRPLSSVDRPRGTFPPILLPAVPAPLHRRTVLPKTPALELPPSLSDRDAAATVSAIRLATAAAGCHALLRSPSPLRCHLFS